MFRFEPNDIAGDCAGIWSEHTLLPEKITGFHFDTRELSHGEIFLAIPGEGRDGHDYLNDAKARGAAGAIVERVDTNNPLPQLLVKDTLAAFQSIAKGHRMRFPGKVVGITGSCGKTTTKDLIATLLGREQTHATRGNLNNTLGVPFTISGIDPSAHKFAVVEAGINVLGEMEQMAPIITPDVAVTTNIHGVHLEGLKSPQCVAREKVKLSQCAAAGGTALMHATCLDYKCFRELQGTVLVVCSEKESSILDFSKERFVVYSQNDGGELVVKIPYQAAMHLSIPVLSDGWVCNVAMAVTVARLLGVNDFEIRKRFATWEPAEHRGQIYDYPQQTIYADCYNATPVALRDALAFFEKRFDADKPRLYLLGCLRELGPEAAAIHRELGKAVRLRAGDRAMVIGEFAENYASGITGEVSIAQEKSEMAAVLENFVGNVFIKGSKPYRLWELIPENAVLVNPFEAVC